MSSNQVQMPHRSDGDFILADIYHPKNPKIPRKIFKNLGEWYNPEIDFNEMVENFKWTEDIFTQIKRLENRKEDYEKDLTEFPLKYIMLLHHGKQYDYEMGGKEKFGHQQMFQFWNKQFNDSFAEEIKKLNPKLVLDVCAGDGQLAKILSDRDIPVKATDNYSWPFDKRYFEVEKLDYKEALKKYQPDVVIGCWMNWQTNWTPQFRSTKSVKHYIQIGENDGGCTGGEFSSRKGWTMKEWEKPSMYSLCRTDTLDFDPNSFFSRYHSTVVCFSRKNKSG